MICIVGPLMIVFNVNLRLKQEKINIFDIKGETNYTKGVINDVLISLQAL